MSSSLMEMVMSPVAVGEAIKRDERNWDDIFPLIDACKFYSSSLTIISDTSWLD